MYESSVDILPVSGVWIGGEGGGWDLEIGVNEILEDWEHKAKRSQCFFWKHDFLILAFPYLIVQFCFWGLDKHNILQ